MSGSAARWREEQILVICPGSRTTMAQLGCNELTPPVHRMPTRMFLDPEDGGWRPYHTFKRRKGGKKAGAEQNGDEEKANGDEDEWEWVEDQDSEEGAVYPMQAGRIVNMPAFLAFLDHIHSLLTTTYHNTPIVLMASPQWTRDCVEEITQFIFEKTKTPALCMIHSAIATQYGLRWPNMTVVDIGFEKVDVTCIFDGAVMNHQAIGVAYGDDDGIQSGGEVFTRKLLGLLEGKGFSYDMAEQLKKSAICEVLPYAADLPDRMELPKAGAETAGLPPSGGNPAADAAKVADSARVVVALADEDEMEVEDKVVADGVLDVAAIVTTGQTKEFLAKKEKEKAKSTKKTAASEAQASRIARLPNSKRTHNVFHYEEVVQEEVPKAKPAPAVPAAPPAAPADAATTENGTAKPEAAEGEKPAAEESTKEGTEGEKPAAEEPAKQGDEAVKTEAPQPTEKPQEAETAAPAAAEQPPRPDSPVETELQPRLVRRDIEVGLERFRFADRDQIDRITTLIWKTIQGVPDMFMRPACWDHIAIVGNGSRVRGLRENIIQTLTARHLISPSSATIFTSELPSNMATPTGTGSQTPTGSFTGTPHQLPPTASSVNPLLQAATTATLNGPLPGGQLPLPGGAPGSEAGVAPSHRFHSQTPTSIKLAPLPTYLAEWSKNGYEEAMFLGAQVAGRIAFCLHNLDGSSSEAQRRMSLSRVEYNEIGPKGVRKYSMLQ